VIKQQRLGPGILVMTLFALSCFGLLLFLWNSFGGPVPFKPKGYEFHLQFRPDTQVAQQADVSISGVSVGKVTKIKLIPGTNLSDATIKLEPRYAPIPRDARAMVRQKTLLGETYIDLTPGTRKPGNALPEGATLPLASVAPSVELEEIFRAFDEKTRRDVQVWFQSQAEAVKGRGAELNSAFGNLEPFAEESNKLLTLLNSQEGAVQRLVRNTGVVYGALSQRDDQLRSLIENSNELFRVTGKNSQQLADFFSVLPTFEKESILTLNRLNEFAKKNDKPLREDIRPFAREFSAAMPDVTAIAPDFRDFIENIGPISDAGRKGLPASRKFFDELQPLIQQFDPFLRSFNPFLEQLGNHRRDFMSFVLNGTMVTQGAGLVDDTPVHYLRGEPTLSPEALAAYSRRLPSNRNNPYAGPDDFAQPQRKSYPTWDTAMCDKGGLPALPPGGDIMDQDMIDLIYRYAYLDGNVVSPPCITHAPVTEQGSTSLYPQIRRDPPGG
jgi:phospholipid/cholesterol/gamma-HCH transport system substrate-binding protein